MTEASNEEKLLVEQELLGALEKAINVGLFSSSRSVKIENPSNDGSYVLGYFFGNCDDFLELIIKRISNPSVSELFCDK